MLSDCSSRLESLICPCSWPLVTPSKRGDASVAPRDMPFRDGAGGAASHGAWRSDPLAARVLDMRESLLHKWIRENWLSIPSMRVLVRGN